MKRDYFIAKINEFFAFSDVVAVLGPRQCGKTTIAQEYFSHSSSCGKKENYFDLENDIDLSRLDNPYLALENLIGLIVIDEVQRRSDLFRTLRVLVDKHAGQKYLILGSASKELLRQSSETLAGRIAYIELTPFNGSEVNDINLLWERGGFPKAYLATNDTRSLNWRLQYIKTFLEQDLRMLDIDVSPENLRRFWYMIANYHGNIFNASEISRNLNLSQVTVKRYLDILTGTFMLRTLRPWHENLTKRQVKMPKIYFRDSGIFHAIRNIRSKSELLLHSVLGSSWEGFALEEVIRCHQVDEYDCYFWSTHSGAEIDLLIVQGDDKFAYEFKYSDNPKITKSMHSAISDLKLKQLIIIIPGDREYLLSKEIKVIGIEIFIRNFVRSM